MDYQLAGCLKRTGREVSFETGKPLVPPPELADAMNSLAQTKDFEFFPISIK